MAPAAARSTPSPAVPGTDRIVEHDAIIDRHLSESRIPHTWRLPMQVSSVLPFSAFACRVEQDAHRPPVVVIEAQLPCPMAMEAEQSRMGITAHPPRFVMHVPDATWRGLCALAAVHGLTSAPETILALLVGERLSHIGPPPGHRRQFIAQWAAAFEEIAKVMCNMRWAALAIPTRTASTAEEIREIELKLRTAVHTVRSLVKADAEHLAAGWGRATTDAGARG